MTLQSKKRKSGGQWVSVPFELIDCGAIAHLGRNCFLVYLMLRRFVLRKPSREARVAKWQREGYLVMIAHQSGIAAGLGVSRQTVCSEIRRLNAMDVVHTLRLGNNKRAYVLGWTDKTKDGLIERYFLDEAAKRAFERTPREFRAYWNSDALSRRTKTLRGVLAVV